MASHVIHSNSGAQLQCDVVCVCVCVCVCGNDVRLWYRSFSFVYMLLPYVAHEMACNTYRQCRGNKKKCAYVTKRIQMSLIPMQTLACTSGRTYSYVVKCKWKLTEQKNQTKTSQTNSRISLFSYLFTFSAICHSCSPAYNVAIYVSQAGGTMENWRCQSVWVTYS